jgi:hypothetical protein
MGSNLSGVVSSGIDLHQLIGGGNRQRVLAGDAAEIAMLGTRRVVQQIVLIDQLTQRMLGSNVTYSPKRGSILASV